MRGQGIILLVAVCLAVFLALGASPASDEIPRLVKEAGWKAGDVVADVGAGDGTYSFALDTVVGPTGKVYATELDEKKLVELMKEAANRGLKNVDVRKAGEKDTNLPAGCCDGVLLRRVYHHLTAPKEIDASLFKALKPNGILAIIDFPPRSWLSVTSPVKGVPSNRGGHGIPQNILVEELRETGFVVDKTFNDWPDDNYCVLFRKPASPTP